MILEAVLEVVLNGIAMTGIEVIAIEKTVAVARPAPRATKLRLATARRSTALPIVARHTMAHHDMNRTRVAHMIAAPDRVLVLDVRTKALRVANILTDGPRIEIVS